MLVNDLKTLFSSASSTSRNLYAEPFFRRATSKYTSEFIDLAKPKDEALVEY